MKRAALRGVTAAVSDAPLSVLLVLALAAVAHATSSDEVARTTAHGSDASPLPSAYREGTWLPLEGPVLSGHLVVTVDVDGVSVRAYVDTGAQSSVVSGVLAAQLGLASDGRRKTIVDSNGRETPSESATLTNLTVGARRFTRVGVQVVEHDAPMLVLGADVLAAFDLYVAADDRLLGLFPAGLGPFPVGSTLVLGAPHRNLLAIPARANGKKGSTWFDLVVDTGATSTAIPSRDGIKAGLPADLKFTATSSGLGSTAESRGRFVVEPLYLGSDELAVPHVYAFAGTFADGQGIGLLGNDVLTRAPTLISLSRALLAIGPTTTRPTVRTTGPGGAPCGDAPCVAVSFVARPPDRATATGVRLDRCLQVDVHARYAGRTVELAVVGDDARGRLPGGLRVLTTVGPSGVSGCFGVPRGMTRTWPDDAKLSLVHVRAENVRWSCDPIEVDCVRFTGPMPMTP